MSEEKTVSKPGGDNELTDAELGKVAGGIEGESSHQDHKGDISVGSIGTTGSRLAGLASGGFASGAAGGAGKPPS